MNNHTLLQTTMTIKQQLIQEIESTSESLLVETLDFLQFIKAKQHELQPATDTVRTEEITQQTPIQSTGHSLLEHLKTIGSWEGDDLEECLQQVYTTRGKAKFRQAVVSKIFNDWNWAKRN